MLRFQFMLLLTFTLILILIAGCSGNKSKLPEKADIGTSIPWWDSQSGDKYVYLYGEAVNSSESISKDNAQANALQEKEYIESYIKKLISKIEQEAGIEDTEILKHSQETIRLVSNIRYTEVSPGKSETIIVSTDEGESYKTYIQMMIPKMVIDNNLVYQIRNDEVLYNQFKASETFNALNERVK